MILPFSTKINGKPTWFVYKIWQSLKPIDLSEYIAHIDENNLPVHWIQKKLLPKLHTIIEDKNNRWKPGIMIDFFINSRTKDMFRFAPRIPVISKQRIFMTYLPQCGLGFRVSIDGRELAEDEVEQLAFNDGFEAVDDFEDYFIAKMENDEYYGKIIHWTDLKY
jgi:hypothetical protein